MLCGVVHSDIEYFDDIKSRYKIKYKLLQYSLTAD